MLKRLAFIIVLAGFAAAAALAATPTTPLAGKVQSTAADTVVVAVKIENAEWLKVGAPVRLMDAVKKAPIGKCMVIAIADSTVTMLAPKAKAKDIKPGAAVTLDKPKAGMTGC